MIILSDYGSLSSRQYFIHAGAKKLTSITLIVNLLSYAAMLLPISASAGIPNLGVSGESLVAVFCGSAPLLPEPCSR